MTLNDVNLPSFTSVKLTLFIGWCCFHPVLAELGSLLTETPWATKPSIFTVWLCRGSLPAPGGALLQISLAFNSLEPPVITFYDQ